MMLAIITITITIIAKVLYTLWMHHPYLPTLSSKSSKSLRIYPRAQEVIAAQWLFLKILDPSTETKTCQINGMKPRKKIPRYIFAISRIWDDDYGDGDNHHRHQHPHHQRQHFTRQHSEKTIRHLSLSVHPVLSKPPSTTRAPPSLSPHSEQYDLSAKGGIVLYHAISKTANASHNDFHLQHPGI